MAEKANCRTKRTNDARSSKKNKKEGRMKEGRLLDVKEPFLEELGAGETTKNKNEKN